MNFEQPVHELLVLKHIPASRRYLKQRLLSHPDFPSILSVSETLEELNIGSHTQEINRKDIDKVLPPFIIHLNGPSAEFFVVRNFEYLQKKRPNYMDLWSGVVLEIDDGEREHNDDHAKELLNEKNKLIEKIVAILVYVLICFFAMTLKFSLMGLVLIITSLIGTLFSILIIQHELGFDNGVIQKLCHSGTKLDCNTVMKYRPFSLPMGLSIGDLSLAYFVALNLSLPISILTDRLQPTVIILSVVGLCSVLLTFISLYVQWQIIRKWCTLCLGVIGILWVQFIFLFPALPKDWATFFDLSVLSFMIFNFAISFTFWAILLKPSFLNEEQQLNKGLALLRHKRNPELFEYSLYKQRKVDIGPFKHDLQLGNSNSPLQILIAANPYCGPCAEAHKLLDRVMNKFNWDIGMTVRFNGNPDDAMDNVTKAVTHLFQVGVDAKARLPIVGSSKLMRKVLNDWYLNPDIDKSRLKYLVHDSLDVNQQLQENHDWFNRNTISSTPTIFINGYELPRHYQDEELGALIRHLMDTVNDIPAIGE